MTSPGHRLALENAEAWLYPGVFPPPDAAKHFKALYETLAWQETTINLFGRQMKSPRLSCWYGDKPYTYSGLTWPTRTWPQELAEIHIRVGQIADTPFNGALVNLYRDGRDSMGWHADDEPELGPDPIIASVVFGTTRRFVFRNKSNKTQKLEVPLTDGDVLVMGPGTQTNWLHAVPKSTKPVGPRINLTFRWIEK